VQFSILNLNEARFECTFGRGCEGICCREGRPPVYPDESLRIQENLPKLLPLLRPTAAALITREGFMSRRRKAGTTTLRVIDGWCVFFNAGCVLHKAGAKEGDKFRYKPFVCATFPIEHRDDRGWYVRQKGIPGEVWDLFCLDPANSDCSAASSLTEELSLVQRHIDEIES
jgi:hypothetical protein